MSDIFSDLTWRGLIHQTTDDAHLPNWLRSGRRTVYAGFDPTSDSLHIGHMLPLLYLRRFQRAGHRPIALVGGATGMIGDPSGKSAERNLLSVEALERNVAALQAQMRRFLDFDDKDGAVLVNNFDWMKNYTYLDFLRDIGKNFPVNVMKNKDSVRSRLEGESGISYTEFSYMLLQAYDFVHLNKSYGCELQVGGSDQWGNITAGIDLARRMGGVQLYGVTCPLLLKSDGTKMGKTEAGALYLAPEKTLPYTFYQYWINVADDDAGKCLRFLTELPHEEIEALDKSRAEEPSKRISQRRLAEELTRLVHGDEGLAAAEKATQIFFGGEIDQLQEAMVPVVFPNAPIKHLSRDLLNPPGMPLIDALAEAGLAKSKGEARRAIEQGGAYVNNRRATGIEMRLTSEHLVTETVIVLRKGKKDYAVLQFDL